jgi:cell division protein FtsI (penicillin-binding protein 3)
VDERRRAQRRLTATLLALFVILIAFSLRLADIQVVQASTLNADAAGKRSINETTYGTRGSIVDSDGTVLAYSVNRYDIKVAPNILLKQGVTERLTNNLADIAELTGKDPDDLLEILTTDPESNFAYLVKGIDTETFRAVRDLSIAGLAFEPRPTRIYPNGAIAGNLVGFVGTDGAQAGTELMQDECLASTNGSAIYERSADGVRLPNSTVTLEEPVDGGNVRLTIDSDLQWFAQQALAEQAIETKSDWATAWVVRVKDGHIMAAADWPTVDPNDVSGAPRDALGARSFTHPYEPGSTFKAMAMAMLLDAGVADPTTQIVAKGRFELPTGEVITDAWDHGDLNYTLAGALVNSSNTGISALVDRLPAEARYEYLEKFGVGSRTAVGFSGESAGISRPVSAWQGSDRYNIMFGQGVSATTAQVASIYQTLGNGGLRMPLTLIEGCERPDGNVEKSPAAEPTRVVSERAADGIVSVLENTVTQGTLQYTVDIPGYRVAAKTGTAEVAKDGGGGYGTDRIVSVAGVAPAEDPEYAVIVTLGLPDTIKTSAAAAPTFSKIMSQTLTTFRVTPSTEPAPQIPLTW